MTKINHLLLKAMILSLIFSMNTYSKNDLDNVDDLDDHQLIMNYQSNSIMAQSSDSLLTGKELLSCPTDKTITIHLVASQDITVFISYSTDSQNLIQKSTNIDIKKDSSSIIMIENLLPNTQYFYSLNVKDKKSSNFISRNINTFYTQRVINSSFSFAIEADPHLDSNSLAQAYELTLKNIQKDNPDFLIDLGDNFMCEKLTDKTQKNITERHLLLRSFYEQICHSVPLYLVLGNHEGEWGNLTDNNAKNLSILTTNTRKFYFTNPTTNTFYTGDNKIFPQVGIRQGYYSWEWGNALFVVLDPYWFTNPKTGWGMTLGIDQYNWFKNTLKASNSKYKFVFCHNLVGGADKDMRGGIEAADFYEWGGKDTNKVWSFEKNRPGWEKPIHQIMLDYGVSIFFHGHDHFYGYQEKDGIIYQEIPQPSNKNLTNLSAGSYGYKAGTLLPGRGYLKVNITESEAKVEYVNTLLPNEEKGQNKNGYVSHSYVIKPKTSPVMENMKTKELINIYPNPSQGEVRIEFNENLTNLNSIKIIDLNGNLIKSLNFDKIFNNNLITWDCRDENGKIVPTGLYITEINLNGKILTSKFIIK